MIAVRYRMLLPISIAILGLTSLGIWFMSESSEYKNRKKVSQLLRNASEQVVKYGDEDSFYTIIQAAQSEDSFTQSNAIATLGHIFTVACDQIDSVGTAQASSVVEDALRSTDLYVLREAADSAGEIGVPTQAMLDRLVELIHKYPARDIGGFAAKSLGVLATNENQLVVRSLEKAARSSYPMLQREASSALERLR